MSPTGGETGGRNFQLTVQFGIWIEQDGTGFGFDSSTGFKLPSGAERSPDVAWVKLDRWNAHALTRISIEFTLNHPNILYWGI